MEILASGPLKKMTAELVDNSPQYQLPVGDASFPILDYLGKPLGIRHQGKISCCHCGRNTKKSFNQGYCYPCFQRLAQCDSCIVSPEKCHYDAGTCREPDWADTHCMTDHFVYLSNTSGVKVGITRGSQIPTRWIDQGASQAMPIMRVKTRLQSGLVEVVLKQHVADKTSWQRMLKGEPEAVDLTERWRQLYELCKDEIGALQDRFGIDALQVLQGQTEQAISFPVENYPEKVKSFNLDKTPEVEGTLQGIKGQYLIFDTGVINMRKYTSYHVDILG